MSCVMLYHVLWRKPTIEQFEEVRLLAMTCGKQVMHFFNWGVLGTDGPIMMHLYLNPDL